MFCDFVGKEGEYKAGSKGEKQIGIDSKFNYEEAEKVVCMQCMLVKYAFLVDILWFLHVHNLLRFAMFTCSDSVGKGPLLRAQCEAERDSSIDSVLCSEGNH